MPARGCVPVSRSGSFDLVLLSDQPPRAVARLVSRILGEVPGARVCGVLCRKPEAAGRFPRRSVWRRLGDWLLRLAHACPALPNGPTGFTLEDLEAACGRAGASLRVVPDVHAPQAIEFLREHKPDLGVLYGGIRLGAPLEEAPRQGWLDLYPPPRAAGRPNGADADAGITVAVRRLKAGEKAWSIIRTATVPHQVLDTPAGLALKASLVGRDLLVGALAGFTGGRPETRTAEAAAGLPAVPPRSSPLPTAAAELEAALPLDAPARPAWKLLLRTALFLPWVVARNWVRRLRGSFPVVILFHHVLSDRPHHLGISTERFLGQVEYLRRHYRIVGLDEAVELLRGGRVPVPTVVLTFDDGYQENFLTLRAVAEETGIPLTVFVCTEPARTQREFEHDVRRGERGFLPLTWEQIEKLGREGIEIGSHTRTHFDCGRSSRPLLVSEIAGSKADLEERLGRPPRFFSFPWGKPENMSREALRIALASYPHALSACGGANFPGDYRDHWHLRRCAHPNHPWELELTLQSVLELR